MKQKLVFAAALIAAALSVAGILNFAPRCEVGSGKGLGPRIGVVLNSIC